MQRLGRVASHGAQIQSFKNVQDLQRGNTLTIWRKLEYIVTAIVHRDGFDPRRGMFLEVGFPQKSAISLHKRVDLVSDLALVECVASVIANQSQRFGQIRVLEDVALARGAFFTIKRVGFEERSR